MKNYLHRGSHSQDIPDTLEGKVTFNDILCKFKECYESLYNSAPTKDSMSELMGKIRSLISSNVISSNLEASKITSQVVKDAILAMKGGKMDVSGSYTSDVFKNAPEILHDHLAAIFRSFIYHGTICKEILACAFLPLFKGGLKDSANFDSYRAIAGASQLLKLFEYVILLLWGDRLTTDSLQFGFKKGVSTTQCSWLVMEAANYYVKRGGQVHSCFLDASKAFDKCLFSKLFDKMLSKGIPPIVVRVLAFAYTEQKGRIRLGKKDSEEFVISNGTRQGSVLSPYLFSSCYLDELLVKLRKLDIGCHIAGVWIGACCYADDICLLAPNAHVLQRMVTICEKYALEHNIVFSTNPSPAQSKTKCVLFSGKNNSPDLAPVRLDGMNLPWVDHVDHLGHVLHQSLSFHADTKRAIRSFMARASDLRDNLYFAHPSQKMQAINLYCCDGYGAMIWDLTSRMTEQFFNSWNKQARLSWNLDRKTHTYLIEDYLCEDLWSLRTQILSRYPNFIHKLENSPSFEVRFMLNMVRHDQRSTTCQNIKHISGLINDNCMSLAPWKLKQMIPKRTIPTNDYYRRSLLSVLLEARFRRTIPDLGLSKEHAQEMIISLCVT